MTTHRAGLSGDAVSITSDVDVDKHLQQVFLWDIGPEKPTAPVRITVPKGVAGEPEYDLALLEFRDELASYEQALIAYRRARIEYDTFMRTNGGATESRHWSCDAQDALRNDAKAVEEGRQARRRWYVSSRTRGHERLANNGLPEGVRPGRQQAENRAREASAMEIFAQAKRSDPNFGGVEH